MPPTVSVLMTVHNGEGFLAAAVRSVLDQTYHDLELIAIDDGSTDRSAAILRDHADPRLRVIEKPRVGRLAALDAAVAAAQGEFLAILDADDISLPTRIEKQVDFLRRNQDISVVASWFTYIDSENRSLGDFRPDGDPSAIAEALAFANPIGFSSSMFRRSAFDEVGGFPRGFYYAMDLALWVWMLPRHKFCILPEVLTLSRLHPGQTTRSAENRLHVSYDGMRLMAEAARRLDLSPAARHRSRQAVNNMAIGYACALWKTGQRLRALAWLARAFLVSPRQWVTHPEIEPIILAFLQRLHLYDAVRAARNVLRGPS
jgi:glycosyltransferase involved in cell wall biosynthesis